MAIKREITLTEKFEPGLKHALFSNFSKYSDAFLELTDNAVSNRIPKKTLKIEILVSKKSLRITNYGGYGMDVRELKEFLEWGKIKDRRITDIGAYSQGGKAAMGYLGKTMGIIASPLNKKIEYQFGDDDLHNLKLKKYPVAENVIEINDGYVRIDVGELSRNIKDDELKKVLADAYRPLIQNNDVEICYNGEKLQINPFPIESKVDKFSFGVKNYFDNFNKVKGWVGHLLPRSGLRGGLRCYKLGRLICDREFFGHPDPSYKQTLNLFFGEIHLDHIPVTTNKTDFDRDSIQWRETREIMFNRLKPYIDELLGREIEEPTDEEKKRVEETKQIVAELLKLREREIKGTAGIEGEAFGQKPREIKGVSSDDIHIPGGKKYKPRTPPPPKAIGKRRRLKEFMDWNIRPMDENLRSIIEVSKGGNKLLVINNIFSGYKAAKGTQLYLIETAVLQLTLPEEGEKITPQEYLRNFDELYSFFCENLDKVKEGLMKKKKFKKSKSY